MQRRNTRIDLGWGNNVSRRSFIFDRFDRRRRYKTQWYWQHVTLCFQLKMAKTNGYPTVRMPQQRKSKQMGALKIIYKVVLCTLHLISSVSSRLISTSSPPTSLMANWQVSCWRLKSLIAHRAMIVAVWFPLYRKQHKLKLTLNRSQSHCLVIKTWYAHIRSNHQKLALI